MENQPAADLFEAVDQPRTAGAYAPLGATALGEGLPADELTTGSGSLTADSVANLKTTTSA